MTRMRKAKTALEFFAALALIVAAAPAARADYAVLRSGARLHVTGYERRGSNYVLELAGGQAIVPASEIVRFEPEDTFQPAASQSLPTPYSGLIAQAAEKHGVDERLVAGVIAAESNFEPRAVSPKGARGLMQLMPGTAARFSVRNAFDPAQNIDAGTRYLSRLLATYRQNATLALAAYNAGPERIVQYGGVPPFPETRAYISRVRRIAAQLRAERTNGGVPFEAGYRTMLCPPEQGACRETFSVIPPFANSLQHDSR
jgi:soluble lytic murein transglycosylase-like protein